MANSDNVVRSGLTPKLKDIDTLTNVFINTKQKSLVLLNKIIKKINNYMFFFLKMLTYDMGKAPI